MRRGGAGARHQLQQHVRAPHAAVHGHGARRLFARRAGGGAEQAGPGGRGRRPPAPGPGAHDRGDRQSAGRGVARQGRGGGDRGGAHVHDDPRHPQAGCDLRHLGHEGLLPHQAFDPRGTDDVDLRRSSVAGHDD